MLRRSIGARVKKHTLRFLSCVSVILVILPSVILRFPLSIHLITLYPKGVRVKAMHLLTPSGYAKECEANKPVFYPEEVSYTSASVLFASLSLKGKGHEARSIGCLTPVHFVYPFFALRSESNDQGAKAYSFSLISLIAPMHTSLHPGASLYLTSGTLRSLYCL